MIELKRITKIFGRTKAVDDISFKVEEGETIVLLGTSGCGKTTTLKMINRLTEPSSGMITVNGENILEQSPEKLRRGIGYVLQHHGLFPHYTVAQNIEIVPELLNWDKQKKQQRTEELLEKLDLPYKEFAELYPAQLSGGQQQRVGVARALAADAPVLLMDEPFGALDPITRAEIRKKLLHLEEFKKKTIIMVTHDIQEAFAYGDRVCVMDKGRIVQIGTKEELLMQDTNDFIKNFLEEQRLQLEFKTLSLEKLWEYLPEHKEALNANVIQLNTTDDIWKAMEHLTKSKNEKEAVVKIINEAINEVKYVSLSDVLSAYINYKAV